MALVATGGGASTAGPLVHGGGSSHPVGQSLEQAGAGVAEKLGDARRRGTSVAVVAASRRRLRLHPGAARAVPRGREYEHLGGNSSMRRNAT